MANEDLLNSELVLGVVQLLLSNPDLLRAAITAFFENVENIECVSTLWTAVCTA